MVEAVTKRVRGRPKGSRNTKPAKPRFTRKPSPTGIAAEIEELIEDEGKKLQAEGNGPAEVREERPFPTVEELRLTPEEVARFTARHAAPPAAGPQLTKLFVAAVENGYIIRPAYSDAYKGAADNRSWVVGSREELARMVSWLMAERGTTSPDFLGGPQLMPQPEQHYAAPIGLQADETAS